MNTIDLNGQTAGLLPARAVLYDTDGAAVASRAFVVDVRGRLRSVYGMFGIAVTAITLLLLGSALWRLRQTQLPHKRWRRAIAFALPGLGVGFVLTAYVARRDQDGDEAVLQAANCAPCDDEITLPGSEIGQSGPPVTSGKSAFTPNAIEPAERDR